MLARAGPTPDPTHIKGEATVTTTKLAGTIRLLLAMTFALSAPASIRAEVPGVINFQGILKDGSGNPVANGSYPVLFTIYDAPTGGSTLWSESNSVTTSNGLFTVLLGSGPTPIPDTTFNDTSRYLGIKVGADPEMTPRQPLASVGYSFVSSQWTSSGDDLHRMVGNVGIGTTLMGAKLDVQALSGIALAATGGFMGVSANGGSYGVYGDGGTYGVYGSGGVYGTYGASSGFAGLYGQGGSYGVYGLGTTTGVYGDGASYGVYGSTSGSGDGLYGQSGGGNGVNANGGTRGVYAAGGAYGVVAATSSGTAVYATSSTGTGMYTSGGFNGVLAYSLGGTGVYADGGAGDGVYGYGDGNGLVGSGVVRGLYATGGSYGVVAAPTGNFGTGIYGSDGGLTAFAAQFLGLVDVYGDFNCYGSKSAAVPMNNGEYHAVYAVESPESWFEDFGTAQLVKGRALVTIEPGFAQTVNTTIAYHVFLTPKGDCNGLYVTNEGSTSFEIRELQKGRSDLQVTYRIVAKRKGHEHLRLARVSGPTPEEVRAHDATMRSEMAANAASQEQLRTAVKAEHKRLEAERLALEQQKMLALPSLPDVRIHK